MLEKNVVSVRKYKAGYEVRNELIDYREYGGDGNLPMRSAYTPKGEYIGDPKIARLLVIKRGIVPELRTENSNVCSVGFCEKEQKWYGWSHRALFGFGIGDKLFEENYGDDETLFSQHGSKTITNMVEARAAAANFAAYVS